MPRTGSALHRWPPPPRPRATAALLRPPGRGARPRPRPPAADGCDAARTRDGATAAGSGGVAPRWSSRREPTAAARSSCPGPTPEVDLGEAVEAQQLRDLTRVKRIVGEQPVEHRCARVDDRHALERALRRDRQLVGRPPLEGLAHDDEGRIERPGKLLP